MPLIWIKNMYTTYSLRVVSFFSLSLLFVFSGALFARQGAAPYSLNNPTGVKASIPIITLDSIDANKRLKEESLQKRAMSGPHSKELRIADGRKVSVTPEKDGIWELLPDGSSLWRVKFHVPGATDLRIGFVHYNLPVNASLYLIGADNYFEGPYSAKDATAEQLWTPAIPGDTAIIELLLPLGSVLSSEALELSYVGAGFRDRFHMKSETGPDASGACNVNVACSLGDTYPNEIRSVAYIEFESGGDTYLCSGTLLADVPLDRKNYFLTAAHCVSTNTEAATMVFYWNYQSTQCSSLASYSLSDNQTGATLRATRADVDFTLVELSQTPDASYHVYYAGWDATGIAPFTGSIGLHHPLGDVKKITQNTNPLQTIDSCIDDTGTSLSTHWLTGPYTQGTTEGGSSGSAIFVPTNDTNGHGNRVIGSLSGGDASCSFINPSHPNSGSDCYGKLSVAWNGASASSRLRDWLDPKNTGTLTIQGVDGEVTSPITDIPDSLLDTWAAEEAAQFQRLHGVRITK